MTPLHRFEAALVAPRGVAAQAQPIDAALATAVVVASLELKRIMR